MKEDRAVCLRLQCLNKWKHINKVKPDIDNIRGF